MRKKVLFVIALNVFVLNCPALSCSVLLYPAISFIVLHFLAWSYMVLHCSALSYIVQDCPSLSCNILHCQTKSCFVLLRPASSCTLHYCPALSDRPSLLWEVLGEEGEVQLEELREESSEDPALPTPLSWNFLWEQKTTIYRQMSAQLQTYERTITDI